MRHNKLAGTGFLLGSRKHKPSTFTSSGADDITTDCNCGVANKDMLHSKSTYFYRWFGEHLGLVVSGLSAKTSYIVPAVCGAALLCGIGMVINPTVSSVQRVYAATDTTGCKTTANDKGICAMELAIFMNGTDDTYSELPATELSADNVVHRDYNFSVRAVDTKDGYDLYAGVVNTGSFGNNLVNADYPTEEHMIKALSGTDVAYNSIGNNEWGYALTSTNQNAEELNYNSLPVATITTEDDKTTLTNGKLLAHGEDTGYDPSQPVGEDKHTDQDYKLYFAAKAGPDSPAGHYRTQVMLSLVANPKIVNGLGNITKMSELTAEHCKNNVATPDAFKADGTINTDVPIAQLIDDREGENGTKYWVAKLADGNCWMTQNMAYDNGAKSTTNKNKIVEPGKTFATDIGSRTPSDDPLTTDAFPTADTYNAHYQIGNYYNQSQATTVCSSLGSSWKVPTSNNTNNGSFAYLLDIKYTLNNKGLRFTIAPVFFVVGGYDNSNIGGVGGYWSSTDRYALYATSSSYSPSNQGAFLATSGLSVRCFVSGS